MTKDELQKEYQQLVNESYEDIERVVIKKLNKAKLLGDKIREIELNEEENKIKKTNDTADRSQPPAEDKNKG